jgi:hypothetical protein
MPATIPWPAALVSRRPVDLPGEKQSADALGFQAPIQLGRLNEVVLDGVAGTQQDGILQPGKRMHQIGLHVARQRHRKAVHVDLRRLQTFRLEKNLVPLLVGEANDLVLERRTVSRTDAVNLAVEEGRASDVGADKIANAIVGVDQMAVDLRPIDRRGQERKRYGRRIAVLDDERSVCNLAIEVNARPIEAWRRTGLQSSPLEPAGLQRLGQLARRRFTGAAGRVLFRSDVNETVQKGAGRHDNRSTRVRIAVFHREAGDLSMPDQQTPRLADQPLDVRLLVERRLDPASVDFLVGLGAWRPDGRPAAAIEQLELDARGVDGAAHQAAERVDLPN